MVELFLARKDLLSDIKIVSLVILLLAFSFLNITFFASYIAGLGNTFQNDIINTQTGHVMLEPEDERDLFIEDYESARNKITLVPGVLGVAVHLDVPATIESDYDRISVPMLAIDPRDERTVTDLEDQIIIGDYLGESDTKHILLGKDLAGTEKLFLSPDEQFGVQEKGLNVRLGEKVKVTFPNGEQRELRIRAIAGREGPGIVSRTAYITTTLAEEVMGVKDVASRILVRVPSKEMAKEYKTMILGQGISGADVKTWEEASGFAEALGRTFGISIYITSAVGILIAILTVSIVIFINVNRKRRQIAVLKAIGASDTSILFTYLSESVLFGILGVALGIVISNLLAGYLTVNPIDLPVGLLRPDLKTEYLFWAGVAIMASSIIAGYIPARTAAKQEILKHIRVT